MEETVNAALELRHFLIKHEVLDLYEHILKRLKHDSVLVWFINNHEFEQPTHMHFVDLDLYVFTHGRTAVVTSDKYKLMVADWDLITGVINPEDIVLK